jgi:hypothetical protein
MCEPGTQFPTKSQRIREKLGARCLGFMYAAFVGATLSFAVTSSVSAAKLETNVAENMPPLPEVPPQSLSNGGRYIVFLSESWPDSV